MSQEVSITVGGERDAAREITSHTVAQTGGDPVLGDFGFAVDHDSDFAVCRTGCAAIESDDGVAELQGLARPRRHALRQRIAGEEATQNDELSTGIAEPGGGNNEIEVDLAGPDVGAIDHDLHRAGMGMQNDVLATSIVHQQGAQPRQRGEIEALTFAARGSCCRVQHGNSGVLMPDYVRSARAEARINKRAAGPNSWYATAPLRAFP